MKFLFNRKNSGENHSIVVHVHGFKPESTLTSFRVFADGRIETEIWEGFGVPTKKEAEPEFTLDDVLAVIQQ